MGAVSGRVRHTARSVRRRPRIGSSLSPAHTAVSWARDKDASSSERPGAGAAWRALLGGHAISPVWFFASQPGWISVHFPIAAGALLVLVLVLLAAWLWQGASGQSPDAAHLALVDRRRAPARSASVRWGWAVLLLLTAALVIGFW